MAAKISTNTPKFLAKEELQKEVFRLRNELIRLQEFYDRWRFLDDAIRETIRDELEVYR